MIVLAVLVPACRKGLESGDRAPARGVGWTMPADAAVRRGALISTPGGREDPLVPVVAAASNQWALACAGARGAAARATFAVDVPAGGASRPVALERATPYEACLAARAVETLGASAVPRNTVLEMTLELR